MGESSSVDLIDLTEEVEGDEPEIISEYFVDLDFGVYLDDDEEDYVESDATTPFIQEDDAQSGTTVSMTLSPHPPSSPTLEEDMDVSDGGTTVAAIEEVASPPLDGETSTQSQGDLVDAPEAVVQVDVGTSRSTTLTRLLLSPTDDDTDHGENSIMERDGLQLMGEQQFPAVTVHDLRSPVRRMRRATTRFHLQPVSTSQAGLRSTHMDEVRGPGSSVVRCSRRLQNMRSAQHEGVNSRTLLLDNTNPGRIKASSPPTVDTSMAPPPPPQPAAQPHLPLCPICQDRLTEIFASRRSLLSTLCGHLFCSRCLPVYCATKPVNGLTCPVCNRRISKRIPYHTIYW